MKLIAMPNLTCWMIAGGVSASLLVVQGVTQAQSVEDVARIASAISVKIESGDRTVQGSGIILQKQGDLYTVLTVAHVVKAGGSFRVTTAIDNQNYSAIASSLKQAKTDLDLAVLQFRSQKDYRAAKIGNSNLLKQGASVYVGGFPAPTQTITRSVFVFREGRVTANADRAFSKGYSLVYSNSTLPGMSGGPVLNKTGELVAIHGQGDRSADKQKTDFNLGIPINRLRLVAKDLGLRSDVSLASLPANSAPKADDYYISANNKEDANDYRGALADYDQAITLSPKYAEAYSNRGNLRVNRLNDPLGALADFNLAIASSRNPTTTATALSRRGTLKGVKLNDVAGAAADFDRAIQLDPSNFRIYINRGGLKADRLRDPQGALADYNQGIALNPNYPLSYKNRGNLKMNQLEDFPGALADYNQAISLNPKYAEVYNNRGILKATKLNDPQGALQDYSKALAINPQMVQAYYNRGKLRKDQLADNAGAISDFRAAAKIYQQQGNTKLLQQCINQLRALGSIE
jgi:tetratricopeptide (TPR) repeat protein